MKADQQFQDIGEAALCVWAHISAAHRNKLKAALNHPSRRKSTYLLAAIRGNPAAYNAD